MSNLLSKLVAPAWVRTLESASGLFTDDTVVQNWGRSSEGRAVKRQFSRAMSDAKRIVNILTQGDGLAMKPGAVVDTQSVSAPFLKVKATMYTPGDQGYAGAACDARAELIPSLSLADRSKIDYRLNSQPIVDSLYSGSSAWFPGVALLVYSLLMLLSSRRPDVVYVGIPLFAILSVVLGFLGWRCRVAYKKWCEYSQPFLLPLGETLSELEHKGGGGKQGWFTRRSLDSTSEGELVMTGSVLLIGCAITAHALQAGRAFGLEHILVILATLLAIYLGARAFWAIRKAYPFLRYWESSDGDARAKRFDTLVALAKNGTELEALGVLLVIAGRLRVPLAELTFDSIVAGMTD